jgi:hypothetical protein
MTDNLSNSTHHVGVSFATLVLFGGMALTITSMLRGGQPPEIAKMAATTLGIAATCYVLVRLVGWAFAQAMMTTSEHQARRNRR